MSKARLPPFSMANVDTMRKIIRNYPNGRIEIDGVYHGGTTKGRLANPKQAAVMMPFCNRNGVPSVLFTLRSQTVGTHKGHVSFPGGHLEPNESVVAAALREFREEMWADETGGGRESDVTVVGIARPLPAITKTMVTPVIGFISQDVGDLSMFRPNPNEVERVFTRPIEDLLTRGAKVHKVYNRFGYDMTMPSWGEDEDPERIWGLTAIILEAVLNKALMPLILNSQAGAAAMMSARDRD